MNDITAQKWINEIIRLKRRIKTLEDVNFKRGRWIMQKVGEPDEYCVCSVCGSQAESDEAWNFCPNCGADMNNEH